MSGNAADLLWPLLPCPRSQGSMQILDTSFFPPSCWSAQPSSRFQLIPFLNYQLLKPRNTFCLERPAATPSRVSTAFPNQATYSKHSLLWTREGKRNQRQNMHTVKTRPGASTQNYSHPRPRFLNANNKNTVTARTMSPLEPRTLLQ